MFLTPFGIFFYSASTCSCRYLLKCHLPSEALSNHLYVNLEPTLISLDCSPFLSLTFFILYNFFLPSSTSYKLFTGFILCSPILEHRFPKCRDFYLSVQLYSPNLELNQAHSKCSRKTCENECMNVLIGAIIKLRGRKS